MRRATAGRGGWPALLVSAGLAACGSEPPVEPADPVPARLVLTASDTITVTGGRLTFTAQAVDSGGVPVSAGPITWSVTNTGRGAVTTEGVFTGGPLVGMLYVRARLANPALAESAAVRIVRPGTVKWTWATAEVGGAMWGNGGPTLGRDGTVYALVGNTGWPDFRATLVALAPDGSTRWTTTLAQVNSAEGVVVTPGTERLWVAGKGLHLLEPTGEELWDTVVTTSNPSGRGGAATNGLLVAHQGEEVVVYGAEEHSVLWRGPYVPLRSWLVPLTITTDGHILAKHSADSLFVFDALDGTILRTFPDPDTGLDKRVFGRGTVPVGDRYYLPTRERLAAFDTAGTLLWLTDWTGNGMTEPAVDPTGVLYVQNRRHGLAALNPDGTLRWSQFYAQPRWPWLGGVALARGGIVYASGADAFWAVNTDGTTAWKHAVDSAGVPQAFLASPAIAPDGTVYTFTSTHVYAFWASEPPEPNSPWPMWRHDAQRTGWAGYQPR